MIMIVRSHAFLHGLQLLGWRGLVGAQTTTFFSSMEHFNSRPWRSSARFSSSRAVEDGLAMTIAGSWTELKTGVRKEHDGIGSGMSFILLIPLGCDVQQLRKVVIERGRKPRQRAWKIEARDELYVQPLDT